MAIGEPCGKIVQGGMIVRRGGRGTQIWSKPKEGGIQKMSKIQRKIIHIQYAGMAYNKDITHI